MSLGLIFDIKRFAIYDGPGIRTTIFFKGCGLNCIWCHNPEGIRTNLELFYNPNKCINCNICFSVCPVKKVAKSIQNRFNTSINCLDNCIKCYDNCPTNAIYKKGEYYSVDKLVNLCCKDNEFYKISDGGVTLSGGEPLLQIDFVEKFLQALVNKNINIVVDTSGYVKWSSIEKIVNLVDLFLFDFKFFDEKRHIEYTGASNKIILENLKKLSLITKKIIIRIPMIPGITDTDDNLKEIAFFIKREFLDIIRVELLPYNPLAQTKYCIKGVNNVGIKHYFSNGLESQTKELLFNKKNIFKAFSINTKVLYYE